MTPTDTPITDAAGLAGVATALGAHAAVGLDTEFMRERTYYAQLCLLQLAAPGVAVCVDTLAVADLTPLRALAASPATTKIIHAARQDLEVLEPALGRVAPLFDTQVAAALCGFPAQVGYADLVREILGVDLHKSQTRTDWSRRPLTDAQIDYALDDVRHLDALRQALLGRLAQLGREAWLAEEMAALADEPLATEPDRAWERLKGIRELDEHRQRVARRLAAWREERAIRSDRPRGWILPDAALRDIVANVPRDAAALARTRELPEGILARSGARILELVAECEPPAVLPPLPQRRRPEPDEVQRQGRLGTVLKAVAAELKLAPELLATRRDLDRMAAGQRDVAPLRGWRRAVVGEPLVAALGAGGAG
jgi:ribonuclease D